VDPVAEREVRCGAVDVEAERIFEAALVVVRRDVRDLQAVALPDLPPDVKRH